MPTIVLHFKEDGTVSTESSGFSGGQCTKDTDKILEGLNPKLSGRRFKAEYSNAPKTAIKEFNKE